MRTPQWVQKAAEDQGLSAKEKETTRLSYLLREAALLVTGKAGLKGLAKVIGVKPTTIYRAMWAGRVTEKLAEKIERVVVEAVGDAKVSKADLMHVWER